MKDLVAVQQQSENSHVDIDLSMIALTKENNSDLKPNYLSIKQDKQKAFRIKKLFNELPVMEVLKYENLKFTSQISCTLDVMIKKKRSIIFINALKQIMIF